MVQPSLQEEHAREIRIRDAPSVVRRRDVAGPDEISENREVLARVRTPIEERPKRGESDRDRAEATGRRPRVAAFPIHCETDAAYQRRMRPSLHPRRHPEL